MEQGTEAVAAAPKYSRCFEPINLRRLDNRTFRNNGISQCGTRKYYKCANVIVGCPATAFKDRSDGILRPSDTNSEHAVNCYPDEFKDKDIQMRSWLKEQCETKYVEPNKLYDEAKVKFEEATDQVPFKKIKSSLHNWRSKEFPPLPKSLYEFANQLDNAKYDSILNYKCNAVEEHITAARVFDEEGQTHILLYDERFIIQYFSRTTHQFADGTFQTRVNIQDCYQMLTVIGLFMERAFCLFYVLMASKSTAAYTAVFRQVLQVCKFEHLKVIMSDFELGLRAAINDAYPNVLSAGCNVHFDRAIYRKVKPLSKELTDDKGKDTELGIAVKRLLALAFLPPGEITDEYQRQMLSMPDEIYNKLFTTLVYFEDFWLKIVRPDGFSIFGLFRRTNNINESINSQFIDWLGILSVPCIHLQNIVKAFIKARKRVLQLKALLPCYDVPKYETVFKDREVFALWKQLLDPSTNITPQDVVESIVLLKGSIKQNIENVSSEDAGAQLQQGFSFVYKYKDITEDPDFDHKLFMDNATLEELRLRENAAKKAAKAAAAKQTGVPHMYKKSAHSRQMKLYHAVEIVPNEQIVENVARMKMIRMSASNAEFTSATVRQNAAGSHTSNICTEEHDDSGIYLPSEGDGRRYSAPSEYQGVDRYSVNVNPTDQLGGLRNPTSLEGRNSSEHVSYPLTPASPLILPQDFTESLPRLAVIGLPDRSVEAAPNKAQVSIVKPSIQTENRLPTGILTNESAEPKSFCIVEEVAEMDEIMQYSSRATNNERLREDILLEEDSEDMFSDKSLHVQQIVIKETDSSNSSENEVEDSQNKGKSAEDVISKRSRKKKKNRCNKLRRLQKKVNDSQILDEEELQQMEAEKQKRRKRKKKTKKVICDL